MGAETKPARIGDERHESAFLRKSESNPAARPSSRRLVSHSWHAVRRFGPRWIEADEIEDKRRTNRGPGGSSRRAARRQAFGDVSPAFPPHLVSHSSRASAGTGPQWIEAGEIEDKQRTNRGPDDSPRRGARRQAFGGVSPAFPPHLVSRSSRVSPGNGPRWIEADETEDKRRTNRGRGDSSRRGARRQAFGGVSPAFPPHLVSRSSRVSPGNGPRWIEADETGDKRRTNRRSGDSSRRGMGRQALGGVWRASRGLSLSLSQRRRQRAFPIGDRPLKAWTKAARIIDLAIRARDQSITAALRMQTIVACAGAALRLRMRCGRSPR